ncbi:DUF2520 domain-containing protein [Neolewinella antarctica]|uniref:Short-subunit dehydrogenase-like oxidoreductase (DUF2520 family) n=1 Tax=Neolewinella antarctica TaxID=442734 RepID=A0ABX0X6U2_9BACT|nr:DUF2520 domain-containing protein [Neolewinella antarctica]NJC24719.1 putative short-subunit dehydrogenase-like oxidoreductase (DUF2520 family) [Neolewinella antarctica]
MQKIVVVGNGNLAWHLVPALKRLKHEVVVVSRHPDPEFEWPVELERYEYLTQLRPTLVLLAVPDGEIPAVSNLLTTLLPLTTPVVHLSGATGMKKIDAQFTNRGVMWPIRSMLKGQRPTTWRDMPIAYQGSNPETLALVQSVVEDLSWTTYPLNSQQRGQLHLAAVFSNNFVTWLYQISYELCAEKGIPFSTLLPIIRNTANRQKGDEPRLFQTGAAARKDKVTMEKHLKLLNGHPEFARLYRLLSHLIQEGLAN